MELNDDEIDDAITLYQLEEQHNPVTAVRLIFLEGEIYSLIEFLDRLGGWSSGSKHTATTVMSKEIIVDIAGSVLREKNALLRRPYLRGSAEQVFEEWPNLKRYVL